VKDVLTLPPEPYPPPRAHSLFAEAVSRGAEVIKGVTEESDEHGTVVTATVKTYGDTVHTFVQRGAYKVRLVVPPLLPALLLRAHASRVCSQVLV
jgi:hypothetical protein